MKNELISYSVLQSALNCGVKEFVVCPAGRNAPFVDILSKHKEIQTYYWPEERSAAFFSLGLSRKSQLPVAIIVTSGTAVGELLPAAMEAYYSGVPLLLITADRPKRFRGSGAPQAAEQVNLFGPYAQFCLDIDDEIFDLNDWNQQSPLHLNVCLEEPQSRSSTIEHTLKAPNYKANIQPSFCDTARNLLDQFLQQNENPLAIVSTLSLHVKQKAVDFLLKLNIPVYLEGISGLREVSSLQSICIHNTENILECAKKSRYPIDGILRIGGVPTNRIWRDIENKENRFNIFSISELPYSGLSWNRNVACVEFGKFFDEYEPFKLFDIKKSDEWLENDRIFSTKLKKLYEEEPLAEPSLMHALTKLIPAESHVYLGNSLPIREWDLAANDEDRGFEVTASRGLNGIDGQIATFLGLCRPNKQNWAILGDLTALYDMAGFWGLSQIESKEVCVVIINNGGGKIFDRMFPYPEMLNQHGLSFEPLAKMWELSYQCWREGVQSLGNAKKHFIEIIPDNDATKRFWKKIEIIKKEMFLDYAKV